MTLVEALSEGVKVSVTGMMIVFSVLIILMLVMMLMKVIFYKPDKVKENPIPAQPVAQPDTDEGELIAVLTAAIAASLNTSTYNLNIKSYRRIENNSPAWNTAGRRDVIDSRF